MSKRIFSLVLVLLVVLACFSGCADSDAISASKLIKNAGLQNGRTLWGLGKSYLQYVEYGRQYDIIHDNKLGITEDDVGGNFLHSVCGCSSGEWEVFTFKGMFERYGVNGLKLDTGYYDGGDPETKEEAVRRIMRYLEESAEKEQNPDYRTSLSSGYLGEHYTGRAGYKNMGVEFQGVGNPYTLSIGMLRGASKQWDTAWYVDFSPWMQDTVMGYSHFEESSATGTSLNLMERARIYTWIGGADGSIAEAGAQMSLYPDGSITPYGKMLQKQYQMIQKYDNIGTSYIPFAMVISDDFNMMPNKYNCDGLGTQVKAYEDNEFLEFCDQLMWKDSMGNWDDDNTMRNDKYGDTIDFIMEDASPELINTYNAIILDCGELSEEQVKTFGKFVKDGGTLIINKSYSGYFNNYIGTKLPTVLEVGDYKEIKSGKGSYIVFGNKTNDISASFNDESKWNYAVLEEIWDKIMEKYYPFRFSDNVGFVSSVTDDAKTIYLYVSENDGVTKGHETPEVYDHSKAIDLTVTYKGIESIASVTDIYNSHEVKLDGNEISLFLDAGDFAVLEIKLK